MQRQSFSRLYARLVSFQRAARNRSSTQGDTTGAISPTLLYTAVALFLILAIIEIDLHREELKALGLVASE